MQLSETIAISQTAKQNGMKFEGGPSSTLTLSRAKPGERKKNMNEVKILDRLNNWPRAALGWLAIMTPEDAVESALFESQQGIKTYKVVQYSKPENGGSSSPV